MSAQAPTPAPPRRRFLAWASRLAMAAGLAGGYGVFALTAVRFLFPAGGTGTRRLFVARVPDVPVGEAVSYLTPEGRPVSITRLGRTGTVDDFVALSSTCPHLGCQVYWEPQNNRYFCPCHNGTFDPSGRGTGGPPGDAGQSLPRYPLAVENGLLFMDVPVEALTTSTRGGR